MRHDQHKLYSAPDFTYGHWNKTKADPVRCRWQVSSNDRAPTFYQCSRKVKVDGLWCKQHSPEFMVEKERKWRENYERESRANTRRWARPKAIEDALVKIAEDNLNDPAGYAAMVLEEWKL